MPKSKNSGATPVLVALGVVALLAAVGLWLQANADVENTLFSESADHTPSLIAAGIGVVLIVVGLLARTSPSTLERLVTKPAAEGWHADPLGRFDGRYYDGTRWTQHVGRVGADGGRQQFEDPL